MKRSLILLGAVTATLASCSKSEVVDVNDSQAIGFETFVNKSTRAVTNDEGTVTNKLLDFYVYGGSNESQNLFAGDKVYRSSDLTPGSMTTPSIGLKTVPISSQPSVREREPIFPPILVIATATWS